MANINNSQNILNLIAEGLITGFSRGSLISKLRKMDKLFNDYYTDYRAIQTLKRFEKRGLIDFRVLPNGETKIKITDAGKKKILKYNFQKMQFKKDKKWDNKWRVVIFDVPEKYKSARDALRRKIESLGMVRIQDSVFVYPYDCFDEITFVAGIFDVLPHISFMTADFVSCEEALKNEFKLK